MFFPTLILIGLNCRYRDDNSICTSEFYLIPKTIIIKLVQTVGENDKKLKRTGLR